jgi:hypothetical protein
VIGGNIENNNQTETIIKQIDLSIDENYLVAGGHT